jgi:hypothetical protein
MTQEEERILREYAAGRACSQSLIDALGPTSLWSKSGFDAEIRRAVEAEREECAKICDKLQDDIATEPKHCAESIRARGKT